MATHSVLFSGKFYGWRSLVGYSPWGHRKSDMTEQLHFLSFYSSFWRRKWQPTPVFLPRESHGWKGLVGYSLWGCKQSDMTKQLTHTHTHTHTHWTTSPNIFPACSGAFPPWSCKPHTSFYLPVSPWLKCSRPPSLGMCRGQRLCSTLHSQRTMSAWLSRGHQVKTTRRFPGK